MGQFRHHSGKTRTTALFWLHTSYHAQRYMFQRYMLRSLLTQSFNIVNTPIILLFSKKWVPGFAAEDNRHFHCAKKPVTTMLTYPWKCTVLVSINYASVTDHITLHTVLTIRNIVHEIREPGCGQESTVQLFTV